MFSGTIKILDIDDYIKPSQECIKPLIQAKKSTKMQIETNSDDFKIPLKASFSTGKTQDTANANLVELYNTTGNIKPDLIKKSSENTAKVSLNDCLACSGCVTTAETILVEQHSVTDFFEKIKQFPCTVVTISPQARSSLAHYYNMNDLQVHLSLMILFYKLGAKYFFDQSLGVDLAFLAAQTEFVERYKESQNGDAKKLPLLCSECPGWVCYAEKIVRDAIIPHMSTVKSPQQIMGNLIKDIFSEKLGMKKEDIYHISIQPCYDKKLEASRREFENENIKEVDTVLSALEVVDVVNRAIEEKNILFEKFEDLYKDHANMQSLPVIQESVFLENFLIAETSKVQDHDVPGQNKEFKLKTNAFGKNNSHSYLEAMVRAVARDVYNASENDVQLNYKQGKNQDIEECTVVINGNEVFTAARIYGLRNIQTLTRNMKKGMCKYKYVEVMACPSGCLNGGGLLKPRDNEVKARDLVKILYEVINDKECKVLKLPEENQSIDIIYKNCGDKINIQTSFKAVDDETLAASKLKW